VAAFGDENWIRPFIGIKSGWNWWLLIIVLNVCGCGDPTWNSENIRTSKQRGAQIIEAITRYNSQYGRYPSTLSDLMPKELTEIPASAAGDGKWHYETRENGHWYWLSFRSTEEHPAEYGWGPDLKDWSFDSGT
jgi:hypothetical protein